MDYRFFCLYLVSVFLASISQILLKAGADRPHSSRIKEYFNIPVLTGYGIMACSMLLGMLAYRGVPLSFGPVIEALGYVFVAVLGYLFLKEKLNGRKLLGMALIMIGIVIVQVTG